MTLQPKNLSSEKLVRWAKWGFLASGVGLLLFFAAYWVSLLLINFHPGFIPNADKRVAMFRQIRHHSRQARQHPRQGDFWIF